MDAGRTLHVSASAHNGRGNDDADSDDDRSGHDGGGDILVLDDFLVEIPRRAEVEQLVANDSQNHTREPEERGKSERFTERLRVPAFGAIRRRRQDGREHRRHNEKKDRTRPLV